MSNSVEAMEGAGTVSAARSRQSGRRQLHVEELYKLSSGKPWPETEMERYYARRYVHWLLIHNRDDHVEGDLLLDDYLCDPTPKGEAEWDQDGNLLTFDGWNLGKGRISRRDYYSVTGYDLVKQFTRQYLKDQKDAKEAWKKTVKVNKRLGIPNPKTTSAGDGYMRYRNRRVRGHSPLIALPAEIRNQIYTYVFQGRILIKGSRPNKEFDEAKAAWNPFNNPVDRPRFRLSHILDNDDIESRLEVSPGMLLVCKQIKTEVEHFMYSELTFCFESMKVIRKFLRIASKEGIKKIAKLELHHEGYGWPIYLSDAFWKTNHDEKWLETCQRIAREMPALSFLRLNILIQDIPVTLHSKDVWFKTLMTLAGGHKLDHVEVALAHKMIGKMRLTRAAQRLENRMMTEEGIRNRDERDANRQIALFEEAQEQARAERIAYLKQLPPLQAKSILKIVSEEKASKPAEENAKKEGKKYCLPISKLSGYTREFVYGESWTSGLL